MIAKCHFGHLCPECSSRRVPRMLLKLTSVLRTRGELCFLPFYSSDAEEPAASRSDSRNRCIPPDTRARELSPRVPKMKSPLHHRLLQRGMILGSHEWAFEAAPRPRI